MADTTPREDKGTRSSGKSGKAAGGARQARLPGARDISSAKGGFKSQGYRSSRDVLSSRPKLSSVPPKVRRRRKMVAWTVGGAIFAVVVTGGVLLTISSRQPGELKATGAFGSAPKLAVDKPLLSDGKAEGTYKSTVLTEGTGAEVAKGSSALVKYALFGWTPQGSIKKTPVSNFAQAKPELWSTGAGAQGMPPWTQKAVTGQKAGSRVVVTVPPKEAFGGQGNQQLQIGADDSLVLVLDVLGSYAPDAAAKGEDTKFDDPKLPTVKEGKPGKGPDIETPKTDPPKKLVSETLIEGTGPETKKGQSLIVQYKGVIWGSGKQFDATYGKGLFSFPLGQEGGVIAAWNEGLIGKKVGSRVLLVVPPDKGYGKTGSPDGTIKGKDTIVFAVDIIDAK